MFARASRVRTQTYFHRTRALVTPWTIIPTIPRKFLSEAENSSGARGRDCRVYRAPTTECQFEHCYHSVNDGCGLTSSFILDRELGRPRSRIHDRHRSYPIQDGYVRGSSISASLGYPGMIRERRASKIPRISAAIRELISTCDSIDPRRRYFPIRAFFLSGVIEKETERIAMWYYRNACFVLR